MKYVFIGLGIMGYPMAGHLSKSSGRLTVYNRTISTAQRWAGEFDGELAPSLAEAVAGAQLVFACVGNDQDSLSVGEVAINAMPPGSIYVDHTTTSAACAEQLETIAKARDVGLIDAPVSGGEAGAVNGALSVMCGGELSHLDRAAPVMDAYAKRIVHIGPVGHGQLCKAVNQIAIAGLLQGLSEAVHFAKSAGIDTDKTLEAISGGAAQSWQMENRWLTMVDGEFDFGFAVKWMRKDLDIVLKEGDRTGAHLPVTQLIDDFYKQVAQNGGAGWDTSSLVTLLEQDKNKS